MKYLIISIPKAGTHLLNQMTRIRPCENLPYGSKIFVSSPHQETVGGLKKYSGLARTHIPYHPVYERILRAHKIRAVFLYRDPRDLLVSYYFWVTKLGLTGESIPGLVDSVGEFLNADDPFMEMIKVWGAHIRRYLPWMFLPELVFPISYEELRCEPVLMAGAMNVFWEGTPFGSPEEMAGRIKPYQSPTFRKALIGDWVNHFQPRHVEAFNDGLGSVLDFLGYK